MPLVGSDKYRVEAPTRNLTWKEQVVQRALKDIKIEDVLSRYYDINVPYDAVSWKVRCPFFFEHEDGGLDKQFRVYSESNSGYCFAMHGRVDNLTLYRSQRFSSTFFDAAEALLTEFNIEYKNKSYRETFEEILKEKEEVIDSSSIIEAMKVYLSTISEYEDLQFHPEVLDGMKLFLDQVYSICENASSLEEVETWYQLEKSRLRSILISL